MSSDSTEKRGRYGFLRARQKTLFCFESLERFSLAKEEKSGEFVGSGAGVRKEGHAAQKFASNKVQLGRSDFLKQEMKTIKKETSINVGQTFTQAVD